MTKKLFKVLASTLMCTTPIIPVINCMNQNSRNLGLEKYAVHKNEVTESKYFTFNAVKTGEDDSIVSLTQLNDHIAAIEDKAQYELYAAGYTEETVYPIVGQLKANINEEIQKQKEIRGLSANAELDEDGIRSIYGYINNQASILGLDVADFDKFAATIPTLANQYKNDLLSHKYSEADASKEANNYRNDLVSILNHATENLYDNVHLTLAMYPKTNSLSEDTQNSYRDARLSSVLAWIKSNANSLISLRPEGLSLLADYSDNNIGIVQIGDELAGKNYDYMSNFFNYKYSVVEGWSVRRISLDDIPATTPSDEYDQEILNGTHITAPLESLRGIYSTFNKDEILPGYKLHAKIKNITNMTDSHSCSIEFSFGISERDDSYILWDDFLNSKKTDENSKIEFTTTFNDFSLINNISKNVYWKNLSLTANLPTKDTPDSNGVYYSDTADTRTKIDKIMAAYKGDTSSYDLKTNPIILDDDARKGISLPTNFNASYLTDKFYTNQEFALIASDVDTINNTLSINWAIVDKNIGENNHTKNDFYVIKNIPWNINGSLVDTIKVQFNISEELQEMMNCAIANKNIYNSLTNIVALDKVSSDENLEKIKKGLIYDSSLIGIQTACTVAIGILTGIYIARVVATIGIDSDASAGMAVGIVMIGLMTVVNGCMIDDNVKAWNAYKNNVKNLAPKLHKTAVYSKQINDAYAKISNDCAIINSFDSHTTYIDKQKAAIDANDLAYKTNLLIKGSAIEQWIDRDQFKKAGFSDDKINEMIDSLYKEPSYSTNILRDDEIIYMIAIVLNAVFINVWPLFIHMCLMSNISSVKNYLKSCLSEIDDLWDDEIILRDRFYDVNWRDMNEVKFYEQEVTDNHDKIDKCYKRYDKAHETKQNLKNQDVVLKTGLKWYPIVTALVSAISISATIFQQFLKPYIIK